ncbi:MAG TPA: PLP-dependent aspartate aminotransferase family protein [Rhizobiaceae bacterium]|nr:PLP-dependent aspartate aminotransferase family protein [Rhizobiaceae bacterium]
MSHPSNTSGLSTLAIHAGDEPDPVTGSVADIVMSSTYVVKEKAGFSAHDLGEETPFIYTRWGNPTVDGLQRKMSALEGTQATICFASGMAATAAVFFSFLSAGDHLVISDVSYAGVAELARDTLPRFGIAVTLVDMSDLGALANAIRPNTKLIHTETPVNPLVRLTDLAAVSAIAKSAGALHSCDSTFASPVGTRGAEHGVDLVIHSLTKYVGGHGDALGGSVSGTVELISRLHVEAAVHHGGIISPFNAWLIARGAGTLPIRMRQHAENAGAVATFLENHPRVKRVIYPGLASHPQHELARRQMKNFSGMIAFQVGDVADGEAVAERMMSDFEVIHYAVSLGHHRSLCFWMATDELMHTSFRLEGAQLESFRAYAGDGIFRLSVGLEDAEDLIRDLDRVL